MSDQAVPLTKLAGLDLGTHRVEVSEAEMMLYAVIVVGAQAEGMDLLFEDGVPSCPSYAFVMGEWAHNAVSKATAIPRVSTLLSSLKLEMLAELPTSGVVEMSAEVTNVWDQGQAVFVEITVRCDYFVLTSVIYTPEGGGFGGPRRPHMDFSDAPEDFRVEITGRDEVLHRSIDEGDHVVQRAIQPGVMTLAHSMVAMLTRMGVEPRQLQLLEANFVAPARIREPLVVYGRMDGTFDVHGERGLVVRGGRVRLKPH